jgi:large subunit ribosomal protein L22
MMNKLFARRSPVENLRHNINATVCIWTMAAMVGLCKGFAAFSLRNARHQETLLVKSQAFSYFSKIKTLHPAYTLVSQAFRKCFSSEPRFAAPSPPAHFISPKLIYTDDGRQFASFDRQKKPKLKPSIVRRRLNKMRIYEGAEKAIRHSPWRLNLVCQFVAGLPLQEALTQLEFCKKDKAPLVQKVLKRTSNLADIRDGLQPSQLEVAECFATKGVPLKRIKTMGRGRSGRMERRHSHMRVVLREIDFKLRIYQAPSVNQKKKWFLLQQQAERDGARAKAERDEVVQLEKQAEAVSKAKK